MSESKHIPHLEAHNGEWHDAHLENLMEAIFLRNFTLDGFNDVFTNMVRYYIEPNCPYLCASVAGADRVGLGVLNYPVMLNLDFDVIGKQSDAWHGGFPYMPEAQVAVSIRHRDGLHCTDYTPGSDLAQATLAAMVQLAREVAYEKHNQPELGLHQPEHPIH